MYARVRVQARSNKMLIGLHVLYFLTIFQDDVMKQLKAKREEQVAARGLLFVLLMQIYSI